MTTARINIARAVNTLMTTAMAAYAVPVFREPRAPILPQDLPAVFVLSSGNEVVDETTGGLQLRSQLVLVEVHESSKDGDQGGNVEDTVALLADACRTALLANRTLSGACLGLEVDEDNEAPRVEVESAVRGASVTLRVLAYHT